MKLLLGAKGNSDEATPNRVFPETSKMSREDEILKRMEKTELLLQDVAKIVVKTPGTSRKDGTEQKLAKMFGYNLFEDGRDFGDVEPKFKVRNWTLRSLREEEKSSESEEDTECMYKPKIIKSRPLDKKDEEQTTSMFMTRNDWRKAKTKPIAASKPKEKVFMYMMTDFGTYSGGCDEDIFGWLRAFEDNFYVNKDNRHIETKKEASRTAALQLIAKLKDPARSMVENFANKRDFEALYDYLVNTFCSESATQVSRQRLVKCLQRDDETINEFAVRLDKLVDHSFWRKKKPYRDERKFDEFSNKILPRLQKKIT